jgi:alkylated DNA repair dioxygenase AlkB
MTADLFASPSPAGEPIVLPGADLLYYPDCFPGAEADALFQALADGIAWQQGSITVYGKAHREPRLSAWYGDSGCSYTYSGLRHEPLPWTPLLAGIKARVEALAGDVCFNSVLANLYRNGADSVGWHSDDEPELGPAPVIASVTFGQPRPFQLRHRSDKALRYALVLPHGSLLLMRGQTQRYWQHQIPKSARPLAPRINLTFRVVRR